MRVRYHCSTSSVKDCHHVSVNMIFEILTGLSFNCRQTTHEHDI